MEQTQICKAKWGGLGIVSFKRFFSLLALLPQEDRSQKVVLTRRAYAAKGLNLLTKNKCSDDQQ
jgi:hypothetical protein